MSGQGETTCDWCKFPFQGVLSQQKQNCGFLYHLGPHECGCSLAPGAVVFTFYPHFRGLWSHHFMDLCQQGTSLPC